MSENKYKTVRSVKCSIIRETIKSPIGGSNMEVISELSWGHFSEGSQSG